MEEYGTVKSIKIKELQTGPKEQEIIRFSKEREAGTRSYYTNEKVHEGWNAKVYKNMYKQGKHWQNFKHI